MSKTKILQHLQYAHYLHIGEEITRAGYLGAQALHKRNGPHVFLIIGLAQYGKSPHIHITQQISDLKALTSLKCALIVVFNTALCTLQSVL